jgi:hypothetical protein
MILDSPPGNPFLLARGQLVLAAVLEIHKTDVVQAGKNISIKLEEKLQVLLKDVISKLGTDFASMKLSQKQLQKIQRLQEIEGAGAVAA